VFSGLHTKAELNIIHFLATDGLGQPTPFGKPRVEAEEMPDFLNTIA